MKHRKMRQKTLRTPPRHKSLAIKNLPDKKSTVRHVKAAAAKTTPPASSRASSAKALRPGKSGHLPRSGATWLAHGADGIKYSVFIVDDHPMVCEAIAGLVNQQKDMTVCGIASDYRNAIKGIDTVRPDIVTVDISLKDKSGIDLIKDLRALHPKIRTLVFSMHEEVLYAPRALQAGARGYIIKSEAPDKIIDGIRQVLAGKIVLSEPMHDRLMTQMVGGHAAAVVSPLESLSDRELTVFELIGQGLGTSRIAGKISLSIHTVQSYRERIKEKLNLRSASELVQHAVQWIQGGKRL